MEHSLLQFMICFIGVSILKIPNSDKRKKNHHVNMDKSFCTCPMQLDGQIGPCHFDYRNDQQNDLTIWLIDSEPFDWVKFTPKLKSFFGLLFLNW
jgi:hypothetical protein